jgi:hypothetical protein
MLDWMDRARGWIKWIRMQSGSDESDDGSANGNDGSGWIGGYL